MMVTNNVSARMAIESKSPRPGPATPPPTPCTPAKPGGVGSSNSPPDPPLLTLGAQAVASGTFREICVGAGQLICAARAGAAGLDAVAVRIVSVALADEESD